MYLLYYNLSCIPSILIEVKSGQSFPLPEPLKFDLFLSLNQSLVKEGYANVLTDFTTVRSTKHEELIDGKRTAVVQGGRGWLTLAGGLIVAVADPQPSVGSLVLIQNRGDGQPTLEVLRSPKMTTLPLPDLQALHELYFPLPPNPTIDIDVYPETVGSQRLRIDYLKLLKPHKPSFHLQVDSLKANYSSWRKSRGDGNCYYRAVGFSYLEHLCRAGVSLRALKEFYLQLYLQTGYFALKRFEDGFDKYFICVLIRLRELAEVKEVMGSAVEHLEYIYLQDRDFDLSMISILKLGASNYLQDNQPAFQHFTTRPITQLITEILAEGLESEGIVFKVMANLLDLVIVHVMLTDTGDRVYTEEFVPENRGEKPVVTLLLRPGHYDVMYTLQADIVDKYNFMDGAYSSFDIPEIGDLFQLYRTI